MLLVLTSFSFADTPQPECPPECVTDTLEIDTWYPSPYNTYETLNSAKLAVGAYEDTEPSHIGEAEDLKAWGQLKVGRGVIFKPVDPENVDNSQINNLIAPAYAFTQGAEPGELVYATDDKFYHYNGSSWVPQGGSGGGATYIGWGTKTCTSGWSVAYTGYATAMVIKSGNMGPSDTICSAKAFSPAAWGYDLAMDFYQGRNNISTWNYVNDSDRLECVVCVK